MRGSVSQSPQCSGIKKHMFAGQRSRFRPLARTPFTQDLLRTPSVGVVPACFCLQLKSLVSTIEVSTKSKGMPYSADHFPGSQRPSEAQFLTTHWSLGLKAGQSGATQATQAL